MIPFPNKKYNIIYADPPWEYENKNTGWKAKSGASSKYQTMTLEDLKSLPISEILQNNACLFLWSTVPLLQEGLELMKSWGFRYKTMLTWRKLEVGRGLGYWFRGETEHLLLGLKGQTPAFRCQDSNFIQSKVLAHSEKPHLFRTLIEKATRNISNPERIELFARHKIPGWDQWGNEIPQLEPLESFALK